MPRTTVNLKCRSNQKTEAQKNKQHYQTLNAVVLCSNEQILKFITNEQNEVPLFFDEREPVKRHIVGLTSSFVTFDASKVKCLAA